MRSKIHYQLWNFSFHLLGPKPKHNLQNSPHISNHSPHQNCMIQVNVGNECSRCHKSEQNILKTSKTIPHGMSREALQYNWHHCFFCFFVCNRNRTWTILNNPMSSKKGTKPPNKFKQHILVTQCKYPFIQ